MAVVHEGDLSVAGAVYIGSLFYGKQKVEPTPNESTEVEVRGFDLEGSGQPCPMLIASTTVPWLRLREVGFRTPTPTGLTLYVYRTNNYPTVLHWLIWRA